MKKRFMALFMVCILVLHPVCVYAVDPVTTAISVINLEYGTAGLAAVGASAPVAAVAVGVVLAVCAGLTINSKISQASANAGMTKSQYIINKAQAWCNARGKDITEFYSVIAQGVKATSAGYFIMNKVASDYLKQFFNWASAEGEMIPSDQYESGSQLANGTYYGTQVVYSTGTYTYDFWVDSACAFVLLTYSTNRKVFLVYTTTQGVVSHQRDHFNELSSTLNYGISSTRNGFYYRKVSEAAQGFSFDQDVVTVDTYSNMTAQNAINAYFDGLTGMDITNAGGDYDAMTIDDEWESVKSKVEPADGESVVVDPKILNPLVDTVPADGKTLTIDLGDYVEAIRKAFDKTIADTVPAVDTATGQVVSLPLDEVDVAETDLTKTATEDITQNYPDAVDVVNPSLPVAPEVALPNLQLSLTDYFPFCLPFDAYNLLNKLSSDPVTPSWSFTFTEPYTGAQANLSGDLHDWDNVAAVVRNMELIVFIIGLAVVTRNMFLRS